MSNTLLFALWGGLYILCAGLGFIPEPAGGLKWFLVALAAATFVPPLLLIRRASRRKDHRTLRLIRNLAALWLTAMAALLIGNFMSALSSELVGNILHSVLVIVSSPMFCGQYWVLSMFGWAYLMFDSMAQLKK